MSRNERKTSRSYFRRIASNAFEKSISSIAIPYLYRWHFAASHRRPHSSSTVDRPRRKPLCGGERKSFTLSEIRCEVRRDNVFLKVVSSSIGIRLFRGPSDMPGFCSAISTTVLTVSCFCSAISTTVLTVSCFCSAISTTVLTVSCFCSAISATVLTVSCFCSAISATVLTVSCFDIITTYIILLQLRSTFIIIDTLIITANLTRSLKEGLVTLVFLCSTVSSFKKKVPKWQYKTCFYIACHCIKYKFYKECDNLLFYMFTGSSQLWVS